MKTLVAPLVIALAAAGAAACDQTAGAPEPVSPSATSEPLTLPPQETAPEGAAPPADETTPSEPGAVPPPPGEANPDMLGRG